MVCLEAGWRAMTAAYGSSWPRPDPNVISAVFGGKRRELPLACLVSVLSVRGAGSGRAKEGQHCEHTAVVLG